MGGVGGPGCAGRASAAGNGRVRSPSTPCPWRLMVSASPYLSPARALSGLGAPELAFQYCTAKNAEVLRACSGLFSEGLGLRGAGIGLGCRPLRPGEIGGVGGDGGDRTGAENGQEREDPGQELCAQVPEPDGNNEAH